MKKIIIAIDGHSSCGKSTMAKSLAKKIGYIYVDTGAMYRAVAYYALKNNLDVEQLQQDIENQKVTVYFTREGHTLLNGEDVEKEIRTMEVSNRVSMVAALPFVRGFLTTQQQAMGVEKGIVMDGRDIGTAVFPHAELKIFVTASAEVRAQRRYDELKAKGQDVNYDDILKNVQERDYIDSHREVAPLRQAEDAVVLDNSHMTIEEQDKWLIEQYESRN